MDGWDFGSLGEVNPGQLFESNNPRFHLHVVRKGSEPSERPAIKSTESERLSFYRAFTATAYKAQLIIMPHERLNVYVWFYLMNTFFKTLPHSFVHFFLASYAPEEHIFLTKMVPVCHGFKYLLVLAAFFEMLLSADNLMLMLHYALDGIVRKNPWNRCLNATYYDESLDLLMHCYNLNDFITKVTNKTVNYANSAYVTEDNEIFQLSHIEYFRQTGANNKTTSMLIRNTVYFLIIWLIITFFHNQVEKRYFWKIFNGCHWALNVVDILTFLFLLASENEYMSAADVMTLDGTTRTSESENVFSPEFWTGDVDFLSESITAPAIVHILSARSNEEISPGMACTKMVMSNTLIYLFRVLMSFKVQEYVESVMHAKIYLTLFYTRSVFILWPIFYAKFYLGNIFTILFFGFNGLIDLMVTSVVYHCLIQTITYEWVKLKLWYIKAALLVSGLCMLIFTSIWTKAVLFIYAKAIATLTESVFLYTLYPLGRFVDDYTYHYGTPPTRLRILNLRLVPVYYTFKFCFMMQAVWVTLDREEFQELVPHYVWSWSLMVVPLIVGLLLTVYQYLVKFRMTWPYMFRPQTRWGPRDFSERQLRKQYMSAYYISSEVPKLLSRYLMSKRETKVYKVDVRYDVQRRSTVTKAVGFGALLADKKQI